MKLDKNKIFGYASIAMFVIGTALVLIGVVKYREYALGFGIAGAGFYALAWAFNALRGRV
ncbi:MAG: CAL67264 family membrane protein [Flavobacteriaceae bacterium]